MTVTFVSNQVSFRPNLLALVDAILFKVRGSSIKFPLTISPRSNSSVGADFEQASR